MSRNFYKNSDIAPPFYSGGGLRDLFGDSPSQAPAPDYTPMREASDKAATLGKELGDAQLAEGKRQYDQNMVVARPIIAAQTRTMNQTADQGQDYYEYGKSFRPLEQSMATTAGDQAAEAAQQQQLDEQGRLDAGGRTEVANFMREQEGQNDASARGINDAYSGLRAAQGAGDGIVYDQNTGEIERGVGTAVADARSGYASSINQALRQGMRYGYSPARLAAMAGASAVGNASQVAAAANAARTTGINSSRARMIASAGVGVDAATNARNLQQSNSTYGLQRLTGDAASRQADFARTRNFGIQDKATQWARKLDVTGMARGMPGASTGAYSVATNAGNSAVNNSIAPGNSYMAAIAGANGTTMQGQGLKIQGAGAVLNAQNSAYNASQQSNNSNLGGIMSGLGGLGQGIGAMSKLAMFA